MNPPTNALLSSSHSRACHEQKFAPLHCWRANMRLPATIYLIELTEITSKTRADESYTDDYEYLANFLYATFFFVFFCIQGYWLHSQPICSCCASYFCQILPLLWHMKLIKLKMMTFMPRPLLPCTVMGKIRHCGNFVVRIFQLLYQFCVGIMQHVALFACCYLLALCQHLTAPPAPDWHDD